MGNICHDGNLPIPATTTYLITSPFVSSLTINLENGAQFKVKANNLSERIFMFNH